MRPLGIDICCGIGGWTKGMIAAGYDVTGYDIVRHSSYPGRLVLEDVLNLRAADLCGAHLVLASTPCQEFSVWGMRCFYPHPKYPANGIRLFNHVREICEESGVPYLMENVRAAQSFVGPSVNHLRAFHFWGSAVPAIWPTECFKYTKKSRGLDLSWDPVSRTRCMIGTRAYARTNQRRIQMVAELSEIPYAIAHYVAALYGGTQ